MPDKIKTTSNTNPQTDPVAQFEIAMKELEALVQKMERGDLKLEDSLIAFERGIALSQQCKAALDTAELKVRDLMAENGLSTGAPT